jgi:hypothetical protein
MTTLPLTLQEAQALEYARDWLQRMQAEFAEGSGRAPLREMIKNLASHIGPNATLDLMDRARAGSEDAHLILVDTINERTDRHEPLPSFLATYNAEFLTGRVVFRSPPGPKRMTNFYQDVYIVLLMVELVSRFHLKPTRNKLQRRRPCGKRSRPGHGRGGPSPGHRGGPREGLATGVAFRLPWGDNRLELPVRSSSKKLLKVTELLSEKFSTINSNHPLENRDYWIAHPFCR